MAAANQGAPRPAGPQRSHVAPRLARIAAIATTLAYLFHRSHEAGIARGSGDVPGMLWAIGALSFLFFVRALVTEGTESSAPNLQKDLLWGLCAGGVLTILLRLG